MAAGALNTVKICVLIFWLASAGHCAEDFRDIRQLVRYYESLSYDRIALLQQHRRVRRHLAPETQELHLDFEAYQKVFRLRLKPDFDGFAEDFKVQSSNQSWKGDLPHMYSGVLEDEVGSSCQGSVLDGQFEGSIKTSNGTFFIEPMQRYTSESTDDHSVIYHEDDINDLPTEVSRAGFCGTDQLQRLIRGFRQDEPVPRSKRTVDQSKTSCLLHLHVDYLFYQRFGSIEAVIAQVASYMKAVNNIFHKAEFAEIDVIDFKVKSMSIISEENPDDPLQETFIGPEKLLSIYSEMNWGNYCLSYLLTSRDFNSVLGLAWEGKPDNWGGICSKPVHNKDGQTSSLNTGLITLMNFGRYLLPKFVQLTFAHELGHSVGAPHDEGSDCGDLGVTEGKGYFLMFPHAANEVKENTDRFSPCSLRHMSRLLKLKKDRCFVGNPKTCASTTSTVLLMYFKGQRVALVPGSPCSKNQGYCDHFQTCRILDADGPIARLKNSFLNLREFDDMADWMKAHWWAILLGILGVSAVMAGTVCLFGHTLESVEKEETTL
ncbi:disintegrin and metalloproteinase domain-containing protein 10 isoform X1 [Silurus asotus]|uniref:Disintegrin and metalloproteinase domain-containing protein 10 isoform X1 n=1 Tax=Silurus asotus TaxID=30991 RepID=A0AAD5FAP0_SILAS|nr:disintegrin and metalloproteinase domain-containing protein 10 isoform X1 [Silurus asotus]